MMPQPESLPDLYDRILDLWFSGLDTYKIHQWLGVGEAVALRVISDHCDAQVRAGRTYRDTRDKVMALWLGGVPAAVISERLTIPLFFVLWILEQMKNIHSEVAE